MIVYHHGPKDCRKKISIQCIVSWFVVFSVYFYKDTYSFYAFLELGALSHAGLIAEVRKLYDQVYQLGVEEAREMTRGKYLNIFSTTNRKK